MGRGARLSPGEPKCRLSLTPPCGSRHSCQEWGGPCRQPPPGWQEEKWITLPFAPPPPLLRLFELSPPTPAPGSSLASSSGELNLPPAQLSVLPLLPAPLVPVCGPQGGWGERTGVPARPVFPRPVSWLRLPVREGQQVPSRCAQQVPSRYCKRKPAASPRSTPRKTETTGRLLPAPQWPGDSLGSCPAHCWPTHSGGRTGGAGVMLPGRQGLRAESAAWPGQCPLPTPREVPTMRGLPRPAPEDAWR